MVVNGTSNVVNYGTCSTVAATAAKVVSCSNFALITGAEITVKFTTTNTAANPTLNVNNTGAKAIYYRGSAISAGYLAANRTYTFRYNGSQYDLVGDINTDTNTKVTQTLTSSNASYPLLLAPSGQTATTTTTSYFDNSVTLNPSTNTIAANISGNAATADTAQKAVKDNAGNTIDTFYLPLSAGENKKLIGPLGLTENINYGTSLPDEGFVGQLFFVEDENLDGPSLPTGGTTGQVLVKNSSEDGDASWATDIAGNAATASKLATVRTISLTGSITGSGTFDGSGNLSIVTSTNHSHSYLPLSGGTMTGAITHGGENGTTTSDSTGAALICGYGENTGIFHGNGDSGVESLGTSATANLIIKSWYGVGFADGGTGNGITVGINCRTGRVTAKSVYGAVWNDYAEFRICNEDFKPGQVVLENGDDTLSIASQRLQRGCSIISDTFGFAIGETDEAKCPIAVSGRALAYGYESREEFKKHIGWPVCSGPNGTVSIMTEEEEEKYPSRIIGIVSAVPDYETWGTGNVPVNGRIWIKVR